MYNVYSARRKEVELARARLAAEELQYYNSAQHREQRNDLAENYYDRVNDWIEKKLTAPSLPVITDTQSLAELFNKTAREFRNRNKSLELGPAAISPRLYQTEAARREIHEKNLIPSLAAQEPYKDPLYYSLRHRVKELEISGPFTHRANHRASEANNSLRLDEQYRDPPFSPQFRQESPSVFLAGNFHNTIIPQQLFSTIPHHARNQTNQLNPLESSYPSNSNAHASQTDRSSERRSNGTRSYHHWKHASNLHSTRSGSKNKIENSLRERSYWKSTATLAHNPYNNHGSEIPGFADNPSASPNNQKLTHHTIKQLNLPSLNPTEKARALFAASYKHPIKIF
jgi:hypothetical protein